MGTMPVRVEQFVGRRQAGRTGADDDRNCLTQLNLRQFGRRFLLSHETGDYTTGGYSTNLGPPVPGHQNRSRRWPSGNSGAVTLPVAHCTSPLSPVAEPKP